MDVIQLDDNLVNGRTYTFQLRCTNTFILPRAATVQTDLIQQAPDFLQSMQVTSPFTTSLYNVQFTYEGDGSDVVSDVAASMVGACQAVSNDAMEFVGGTASTAHEITVSPSNALKQTEQAAADAITKVGTDTVGAATSAVNKALVGLLPLLVVAVVLILFVLPSFLKSTGARVNVGG